MRGRGDRRLSQEVRADELRAHSSTRRPSVQRGDLAVLYAAGWQVVFALAEVVSDPENDPERARWAWRFRIRPLLALRDLREAPPVEAAGVLPRSLGRHSYIRLTEEQFERAREAIEGAAEPQPAGRTSRSGRADPHSGSDIRMKRVCRPSPSRIPSGSGIEAPCSNRSTTQSLRG